MMVKGIDVTRGEHVNPEDFDYVSTVGTEANPFQAMPAPGELPYGAWCKCSSCGRLGRSTVIFDFYGKDGDQLVCERCELGPR